MHQHGALHLLQHHSRRATLLPLALRLALLLLLLALLRRQVVEQGADAAQHKHPVALRAEQQQLVRDDGQLLQLSDAAGLEAALQHALELLLAPAGAGRGGAGAAAGAAAGAWAGAPPLQASTL